MIIDHTGFNMEYWSRFLKLPWDEFLKLALAEGIGYGQSSEYKEKLIRVFYDLARATAKIEAI